MANDILHEISMTHALDVLGRGVLDFDDEVVGIELANFVFLRQDKNLFALDVFQCNPHAIKPPRSNDGGQPFNEGVVGSVFVYLVQKPCPYIIEMHADAFWVAVNGRDREEELSLHILFPLGHAQIIQ